MHHVELNFPHKVNWWALFGVNFRPLAIMGGRGYLILGPFSRDMLHRILFSLFKMTQELFNALVPWLVMSFDDIAA